MKVYLAADHAGYEFKNNVKDFLISLNYEVVDCGAHEFNPEDDYPDFIYKAAIGVSQNPESMGVVFGGSGQGEAIVANKVSGVRAAVYNTENLELIKLAREHNNANILSIGARFVGIEHSKAAAKLFLETTYPQEERHERRIKKIADLEK